VRAAGEFTAEDFDLPAFRTIFAALVALPPDADAAEALPGLPDDVVPVFERLREGAAARPGLDLDREYVGAAEKLRDRAEFRRVVRIQDPGERRRIMTAWTPERKQRWMWLKAGLKSRKSRHP